MTKQEMIDYLTTNNIDFDPKAKKGELAELMDECSANADTELTVQAKETKPAMVKKAFQPIMDLLANNADAKVSDILEQVYELARAKNASVAGGKTFLKNDQGEVYAVFCYYHKKWELLCEGVEYGKKANTATGLNTMCKEGTSQWTKQQRIAKKAKEQLLEKVIKQELTADQLPLEQELIEQARQTITDREDGLGYLEQAEAEEAYAQEL